MSRNQYYKKYFPQVVWDYNPKKINLDDDHLFIWFLQRKVEYHGLRGIRKKDIITFYKKIDFGEYSSLVDLFLCQNKKY